MPPTAPPIRTSSLQRGIALAVAFGIASVPACHDPDRDRDAVASPATDDGQDSDGDGLHDAAEAAQGSDPDDPDSDDDGLNDLEEWEWGTDPTEVDSDGDGYWDAWEVAEDTDPGDADSTIYECNWPYYPDKDSLASSSLAGHAAGGEPMARFSGQDPCGQQLDLFDLAGHDKPVVIEIAAVWCGWCHELARLVGGRPSELDHYLPSYGIDKARLVRAIEDEELYWVTILSQNDDGNPAEARDLAQWSADHPNDHVALLLDESNAYFGYIGGSSLPRLVWADDDMVCQSQRAGGYLQVIADVLSTLDD
ncbi:MAG: hypothetical protein B7733_10200 [Myxococcales bacterium FL481]|nr:MAG: hypothetical protein B7733_10200 [Myxococcales bacterium FL481]